MLSFLIMYLGKYENLSKIVGAARFHTILITFHCTYSGFPNITYI
jgi:hypothetical protein